MWLVKICQVVHQTFIGSSGGSSDFADGTLDDITIWGDSDTDQEHILTSSDIEKIYWGGNYLQPVVNASLGEYGLNYLQLKHSSNILKYIIAVLQLARLVM